jgi:hypothetical protein
MPVQNIEGSQNAFFSISLASGVSTTFAENCTYNLNGMTGSCAAPPINADPMFTAQGMAYSGTY